jgi:hypothetical protein
MQVSHLHPTDSIQLTISVFCRLVRPQITLTIADEVAGQQRHSSSPRLYTIIHPSTLVYSVS